MGYRYNKQQGAALIISLILMLIMTILAVQGMQTATLEEKMAGNFRSKQRAFQFAETALLEAENWIDERVIAPVPRTDGSNGSNAFGVWTQDAVDIKSEAFWTRAFDNTEVGFSWLGSHNMANSDNYKTVYFIEERIDTNNAGSILASSALDVGAIGNNSVSYRITARVYTDDNSPVITLQSHYTKKFNL